MFFTNRLVLLATVYENVKSPCLNCISETNADISSLNLLSDPLLILTLFLANISAMPYILEVCYRFNNAPIFSASTLSVTFPICRIRNFDDWLTLNQVKFRSMPSNACISFQIFFISVVYVLCICFSFFFQLGLNYYIVECMAELAIII